MNGTLLQKKINRGYAKAASELGLPCTVYRSATLINPIQNANIVLLDQPLSVAPNFSYSNFTKPKEPLWTCLIDTDLIEIGDWLVGEQGTFFVADFQETLPVPVVKCTRTISVVRPVLSTGVSPAVWSETPIATALPAFMFTSKNRGHLPAGFPTAAETEACMPEMEVYINTHGVTAIQKDDVVIDELGIRYEIETYNPTTFGFIVIIRVQKP